MERESEKANVDVIGIGAVNYDYVAPVSKNLEEEGIPEAGDEDLSRFSSEDLKNSVRSHYHSKGFIDTQIGGSAYLAIKTISHLEDFDLNTGCVGIVSTPGELEREVGFFTNVSSVDTPEEVMDEFEHLDDDEWLFETDGTPGRGLIELRKGKRQKARVGPGSNTQLVDKIKEKEAEMESTGETEPFTKYLASAQWIHLTSFANFEQFRFFVDRVRKAKQLNPHLTLSIDPGYEYTYRHTSYTHVDSTTPTGKSRISLDDVFDIADFAFMNSQELSNLSDSDRFEIKREIDTLTGLSGVDDLQAIIVKEENRHLLINFVDGEPYYRNEKGAAITEYWHKKLKELDIKNDTGAGDALAGGVIAGILSPTTLSYKPVPIEIGSALAKDVLQSHQFPEDAMNRTAMDVVTKRQKSAAPSDSWEQRLNAIRANHGQRIEGLLVGIAASGIVYLVTTVL